MTGFLTGISKKNSTIVVGIVPSYEAFIALQDLFLAYNMFFLFDRTRRPDIIRDEGRKITYPILQVVKPHRFSASFEEDSSSESSDSSQDDESFDVSQC